MSNYLKLVGQSFYNRDAVRDYTKNGTDRGWPLLATAAFINALIAAIIMLVVSCSMTQSKIESKLKPYFDQGPRIVINDGELQWANNDFQKFVIGDNISVVVDTRSDNPSYEALQASHFYFTKHYLFMKTKDSQSKQISLIKFNEMYKENPLTLRASNTAKVMKKYMNYATCTGLALLFLIGWPLMWLGYVFLAFIARLIGCAVDDKIKVLNKEEAKRLAAMSITPVVIIMAVISYLIMGINPIIFALAGIIIGLIVMIFHVKEPLEYRNPKMSKTTKKED